MHKAELNVRLMFSLMLFLFQLFTKNGQREETTRGHATRIKQLN